MGTIELVKQFSHRATRDPVVVELNPDRITGIQILDGGYSIGLDNGRAVGVARKDPLIENLSPLWKAMASLPKSRLKDIQVHEENSASKFVVIRTADNYLRSIGFGKTL